MTLLKTAVLISPHSTYSIASLGNGRCMVFNFHNHSSTSWLYFSLTLLTHTHPLTGCSARHTIHKNPFFQSRLYIITESIIIPVVRSLLETLNEVRRRDSAQTKDDSRLDVFFCAQWVIKQNKLLLFRIDYLSILDQADRSTIREFSLSTEELFSYRERRLSEHLVDVEVRKVMRFSQEKIRKMRAKTKRLISVGNKPDNLISLWQE